MERHLRARIEHFADPGHPADGPDATGILRARLAANLAEGLKEQGDTCSARHEELNDSEDIGRVAAYLDGRLTGAEREAFLSSLAANPRLLADMRSSAGLLSVIEAEPQATPTELLVTANSIFASRTSPVARERWSFVWRHRPLSWALAGLLLLVLAPGALFFVEQGRYWRLRPETSPFMPETYSAPNLDRNVPRRAAPVPAEQPDRLQSNAPAYEPGPRWERNGTADQARSAPEVRSCDSEPVIETEPNAEPKRQNRLRSDTGPCPVSPVGAASAEKTLRSGVGNSESDIGVTRRIAPAASPPAVPAPAR
jgi:hypothetical protein